MKKNTNEVADNNSTATNLTSEQNTKNNGSNFFDKIKHGVKKYLRKQLVNIKHRPSNIPMFSIVVTMLIYMLSINDFSRVNLALDVSNSGLISFWSTLFSILVCVLYMNVYPKRQKSKITMLVLTFIVLVVLAVFDALYYIGTTSQLNTGNYIDSPYIDNFYRAKSLLIVHIVFVAISILLCATLPLYTKLLRKIDTSVELEKSEMIENAHALEELGE